MRNYDQLRKISQYGFFFFFIFFKMKLCGLEVSVSTVGALRNNIRANPNRMYRSNIVVTYLRQFKPWGREGFSVDPLN